MDREVVLQTGTTSRDPDSGELLITWHDELIWAQWLPAGTREAWQAQFRLGTYIDGVFRIYDREPRPTPDLSRIVFDGRTFDLKPYIETRRGRELEIPAVGAPS